MKRTILSLLLALAMTASLAGGALALPAVEQADTPEAFAALLAPRAAALKSGAQTSPGRILVRADALTDAFGAQRVIQCARMGVYELEYESETAAAAALERLTAALGADRCWLDTAANSASVLDETPGTNHPDPDPTDDTDPAPSPAAAEYTARSWGTLAMTLDQFFTSQAAQRHSAGSALTIAMLDTGADLTIPDLEDRAISADSFDFVNNRAEISDVTEGKAAGHGTMVTALLDDMLPAQAELMLLRVFDDAGSATPSMVLTALEYALDHGADIINMSLGWEGASRSYAFLNTALARAAELGVPVICAAGNQHASVDTCYPANQPSTIAVSAVNRALNYETFTNYGALVDFAAPGSNLRTVGPGGTQAFARGTSFAAPHVTALAADLMLLQPELDAKGVYEALRRCAQDLGDGGRDDYYGWGLPRLEDYLKTGLQHEWGAWRTDPLATKTQDGARVRSCEICGETATESLAATAGRTDTVFRDVSSTAYYAESVHWAVENAVTTGYSAAEPLFAPGLSCTRAQMVTFLWRAAGSPAPTREVSPFLDVQDQSAYYYPAVLWAVESGITTGTDPNRFSPGATVTRGQTVTFLWRLAQQPEAEGENPFRDVAESDYFYTAVLWASGAGITNGTDPDRFSPGEPCTRGQIVTLLYRDLGNR